jgi:hypothetical protein
MKELKKALEEYAAESIKQARSNLNLTGFAGKKRKTNNTGDLSKGLGYDLKENNEGFDLEFTSKEMYGIFIEKGVNGWKKSQKAPFKFKKKNLAKGVMEDYIKTSKMRLKKIFINKSGQKVSQFVAKTPENIKAAAFMMGRAIARDGIIRTNFMGKASDRAFKEKKDSLEKAMAMDMAFEIGDTLRKQGFNVTQKST